MSASVRRRRLLAAAGVVLLVALVVVLVVALRGGGGGDSPPADEAIQLVPVGALAYAHLSVDPARGADRRARDLAARFPDWPALRDSLLRRLTAPQCGVSARDLRGREAAIALVDTGIVGTAGSLVLLDIGQNRRGPSAQRDCGAVSVRRIGRFEAIGQVATLDMAAQLAAGKGRSLDEDPVYRRASTGLPDGRVLDGYVSAAGLRRLLAPQGGVLGAAGVLLDQPGLQGTAFAAEARAPGARLTLHSALAPKVRRGPFSPFEPTLDGEVPQGVLGYLGVMGLGPALGRLLAASGTSTSGLSDLLARARRDLTSQAKGFDKDLLGLFRGETALTITPSLPAPTVTVVARTRDEKRTLGTLANLQEPLGKIFAPPAQGGGQAPTFDERSIAGVKAFQLRLGPGIELDYAVFGGKLVVSTQLAGIAAVHQAKRHLPDAEPFRSVLGERPKQVSSLLFLDFSELLRLGEQTGLGSSRAYQRVRQDLAKVRAVGATSSGAADETTAHLELSIP